ncbi:ankyrin repeat-containing protein NPR4-like [Senna tora]|uniref:Ankyrin repeat-containing protein NPR4-like n=1 Tax=Senna tora TaxID=362788 RepID=A0A834WIM2_9FABA|nr:ankyrin repeat-containing protein NPR4-like [Senna tora]
MRQETDFNVAVLCKAIYDNDWITIKAFIDEHPSSLTAKLTYFDQTALHVASEFGHEDIVEKIVRLVTPQHLEILDNEGYTPLATASYVGAPTRVIDCMVKKNGNILGIPIHNMSLPVTLALGIALDMLQRCKDLLFAKDNRGTIPVMRIAAMPHEVERVVLPEFKIYQNIDGMKPEEIFKDSHKELRKEGEKWMKETASSCSVVGALVVTIMFAAAFTVPRGNNQDSGNPHLTLCRRRFPQILTD